MPNTNNNHIVENAIFYHIQRNVTWQVGETHFIGRNKNNFFAYYDSNALNYSIGQSIFTTNFVATEMMRFLENGTKHPDLEKAGFDFNSKRTLERVTAVLNDYLILVREWSFEEVRKEYFPNLPSRQRGLWVIPNDSAAVKYWWQRLGERGQIFKLELTGKVNKSNERYLDLTTNSLDFIREQAFKYWAGTSGQNPIADECLFEGFAKVIDIVPIESFE